ncbi:SixA phosphatase family protein [Kaistella palustris]|uniref:SixA phosphatase family protein n=1 Tax=Kaistella palustris TaxID=493376 RepID=UPI0003F884D7|nr:histidine phosphatase family protein [Kaistella palustris]
MKTLILVRHAKSDWPEDTADFDRPLADKGLHDAQKMANFLKSKNIRIGKLVTSPALRARTTAEIFGEVFGLNAETNQKLYNPTEAHFESAIFDLEEQVESAALFSHNIGISNFANSMSEDIIIFPTCGVAVFQIGCEAWSDFENAEKKLLAFYEPKKI